MINLKNCYRKVCLLGTFCVCFCTSFVNAQTVSTVDVSGVDLGTKDYVPSRLFSGSDISWTANRDLWVSKGFYVSGEFTYSYSYGKRFLAIPNSSVSNEQVLLTSCRLQNIKSITFLIARTKVYGETNRVHIDAARCGSDCVPLEGDWEDVYVVNTIEKYIDATKAGAMSAEGYKESQYDRVTYEFSTPYSGYIRLRIDNTNTTPMDSKCPYLLIPELTVVHNAPEPCSSCFSITIR